MSTNEAIAFVLSHMPFRVARISHLGYCADLYFDNPSKPTEPWQFTINFDGLDHASKDEMIAEIRSARRKWKC